MTPQTTTPVPAHTDVLAALIAWVDATVARRDETGEEAHWWAFCPATGQSVLARSIEHVGLYRRPADADQTRAAVETHAKQYLAFLAAGIREHNSEAVVRRDWTGKRRQLGPVVALRRWQDITRDGTRGDLYLDTAAVLAAAPAE